MKNRTATMTVLTSAALAAALGLTGCTSGDGGGSGDAGGSASPTATSGEAGPAMSPGSSGTSPGAGEGASGPSTSTATATQDNRADHMFARMMIPHHQQAIEMSDIILGKEGLDPEVAALAEQIKAAQGPEIEQMEDWLDEWGVGGGGMGRGGMGPDGDGSMGPDGDGSMGQGPMGDGEGGGMMGGMLSEQELQAIEQADTEEATRLFLEGMIVHHEGAIDMAEIEVQNGQYPDTVALAGTIIETQQREIETMRELLGR
jgi:uncharacterized protein (DUF305 family)